MKSEDASRIIDDFKHTVVVIPCSGKKERECSSGEVLGGPLILDDMPSELAGRLRDARNRVESGLARVTKEGSFDHACRMPALCLYSGALYRAAGQTLRAAIESSRLPHLLILSGGYGILSAREPIAHYNRKIKLNDWPDGLIQDVIAAYAQKHGLCRARLFAAGDYTKILKVTAPSVCGGLKDVILFTPTRIVRGGAQVKAPWALGEALAAMLTGQFHASWKSKHGVTLNDERLSWCNGGPR